MEVEFIEPGWDFGLNNGVIEKFENLLTLDLAGVVSQRERGCQGVRLIAVHTENAHELAFNDLTDFLAAIKRCVSQLQLAGLIHQNRPGGDQFAVLVERKNMVTLGFLTFRLRQFKLAKVGEFVRPETVQPVRIGGRSIGSWRNDRFAARSGRDRLHFRRFGQQGSRGGGINAVCSGSRFRLAVLGLLWGRTLLFMSVRFSRMHRCCNGIRCCQMSDHLLKDMIRMMF